MIITTLDDLQDFIVKKLLKEQLNLQSLEFSLLKNNIKKSHFREIITELDKFNLRDRDLEFQLNDLEFEELELLKKIDSQNKLIMELLTKFTKS